MKFLTIFLILFISISFSFSALAGNNKEPTFVACDDICSVWTCDPGCSGCNCATEPLCSSYCGSAPEQ